MSFDPSNAAATLAELRELAARAQTLAKAAGAETVSAEPDQYAPFTDAITPDGKVTPGKAGIRLIRDNNQIVDGGDWRNIEFERKLSETKHPLASGEQWLGSGSPFFFPRYPGWYLCTLNARLNWSCWYGIHHFSQPGTPPVPTGRKIAEVWAADTDMAYSVSVPVYLNIGDQIQFQVWPNIVGQATLVGKPSTIVDSYPVGSMVQFG